jgi:hypothetical protein
VEEHVVRASVTQSLNVGVDLRRKLELVAREQGADATYLGRRILREYLDRRVQLNEWTAPTAGSSSTPRRPSTSDSWA